MRVLLISAMNIMSDSRSRLILKLAKRLGECVCIEKRDDIIVNNFSSNDNICKFYSFKFNGIRNYLRYIISCFNVAKNFQPNVIIADNRAAILPAIFIKILKINNCIYIHDSRELYDIKQVNHLRGKIGCIIEILFMRFFDFVVCANSERANKMKIKYNLKQIPLILENFSILSYSLSGEEMAALKFSDMFDNDKKKILSSDGYSLERRVDDLVEAIYCLGDDYVLYLAGSGRDYVAKNKINEIIHNHEKNNIVYLGILNESELKYCIRRSQIGVVSYNTFDINNQLCASGKFYEFINEGKPVVTTTNLPLKALCDKYKVGVYDEDFSNGIKEVFSNYDFYAKNAVEIDCEKLCNLELENIQNKIIERYSMRKC